MIADTHNPERQRIIRAFESRDRQPRPSSAFDTYLQSSRVRAKHRATSLFGPPPAPQRLEIGCGRGCHLLDDSAHGKGNTLSGIDLLPQRVSAARLVAPQADIRVGCATQLPWNDQKFDEILISLVFSSILDEKMRRAVAQEAWRVLKPGGSISLFDMRITPPRQTDLRAIRATEIREYWPEGTRYRRTCVLAPPISRILAPISVSACHLLEAIPFLRTHAVTIITKPMEGDSEKQQHD